MPTEIKLIYFSDFHGNNMHSAKLGHILRSTQQLPDSITIFAGDFRGKIDYNDPHDKSGNLEIDILNILLGKKSVVAIGNHDTFGGSKALVPLLKKLNRPLLASNIVIPPGSPLSGLIIPEILHTQSDGNEIVFLGVAIAHTKETLEPHELQIQSLEQSVHTLLQLIQKYYENDKRNFIIVSHLGIVDDQNLARSLTSLLAKMQYKLDIVIVGGHSHDITKECIVIGDKEYSQAYIVQNGKFDDVDAHYAQLNLKFENGKIIAAENNIYPITSAKFEKDAEIDHLLATQNSMQRKMQENVLTKVRGPISSLDWYITDTTRYSHAGHIRINDCALMRIFADAMVEKANQIAPGFKYYAFLQAAWFRYNFPVDTEGEPVLFNEYHIHKIDAFNEKLAIMKLTGEQIYQSIEQGVSKLKWMQSGGLLHVDKGIKYIYDASKEPGKRVMFISIDGSSLIKDKVYSIVSTRSLSNGMAEHPELKHLLSTQYDEIKMRDILLSHLKDKYSDKIINESFGERIICLFPSATPENIVAKIEDNMVKNKLDAVTQEPLSIDKLNFDEFQKRQEIYLQNGRDKVSVQLLANSKMTVLSQTTAEQQCNNLVSDADMKEKVTAVSALKPLL